MYGIPIAHGIYIFFNLKKGHIYQMSRHTFSKVENLERENLENIQTILDVV